jgi:hypothetical protein
MRVASVALLRNGRGITHLSRMFEYAARSVATRPLHLLAHQGSWSQSASANLSRVDGGRG